MAPEHKLYIVEHKLRNDFLGGRNFVRRKEKSVTNIHSSYFNNDEDITDLFKLKKPTSKEIVYNYKGIFTLKLPFELKYLESAYSKSEYILNLEDDWDDEGACKYHFEIWKKALEFINTYALTLFVDFNKKIDIPRIYHGPKGSIDILIENSVYSLLINVLSSEDKAIYFGKDINGNISKGEVNLKRMNSALIPIAFYF